MRIGLLTMTLRFGTNCTAQMNRPMVLHARVVAGSGGGPDKTILRSAAITESAGLRMGAAYIHPRNDSGIDTIRKQAAASRCTLWTVPESGPVDPRTIGALRTVCRHQRVSIWHGHDYKSNTIGLILRRFHPMKLVTTAHGWTDETVRTRLYGRIDRKCLSRYDQVIAVSRRLYDDCLAAGVKDSRLSYIPNAIDTTEFARRHSRDQMRRWMNIDPRHFAIGVVGRFSIEKGVDRAVQLLAKLRLDHPNVHLHLIGEGPQREALNSLAVRLDVNNRVTFWGWQRKLHRFYEMMDMLLLPSHTEGLPNSALEAMAMQTPVAATDVGDVSHLLDNGRCGVILDQFDDAWPQQIHSMIESADVRARLAEAARSRIEQHFGFEQRMAKVMQVYRRVLPAVTPNKTLRRAA